jgi:DNA-binding response OmpR family regulator
VIQQAGSIEVTTAASGAEGLKLLAGQQFDLVYLDIRMPDMSGLEALKTIRLRYPDMPVLLLTGQPDLNSAVEALRLGATDYLLKPLKPQLLVERTQTVLSRQERERRKRELQSQLELLQSQLQAIENDESIPLTPGSQTMESVERFLKRGKLTLDLHARRLRMGERMIDLPPTAFDYLLVLARHSPNVVDYQTLVAEAQGHQVEFREAQELVKWHIHHLRQAIEPDAQNPVFLINVRGTGYRLVPD